MFNLFLHHTDGKLVDVDVMHDVTETVYSELMKAAPLGILAVLTVDARLCGIMAKYLSHPVLPVMDPATPSTREVPLSVPAIFYRIGESPLSTFSLRQAYFQR